MTITSNFVLKYTSVSKLPRKEILDIYSIDLFALGHIIREGGEVLEQAKLTHWDGPPSEKAKRLRRHSQIHYTQTALKTVYIFYYSPRAFNFF